MSSPVGVILLACGSFNPPTNMHLRMFEIARDHLHRIGQYVVLGGIISPVHDAYGKNELESATHRLNMVKLALHNHEWVKVSDWELKQESWSRTKLVLQHHQNQVNAILHPSKNNHFDLNEEEINWVPDSIKNGSCTGNVVVKLLCGGDLLESFGTPGLWDNEDLMSIVGQHGLVVITRSKTNPNEFIYNSDMLTKCMNNIVIVTEWIRNEISSTKIRRSLRRSESVKYLLSDKVIDYIHRHRLYGSEKNKYVEPTNTYNVFLTPSPSDIIMESPTNTTNCLNICNNNPFTRAIKYEKLTIDTVDANAKNLTVSMNAKHPGQAVKIVTEIGPRKIGKNEVGTSKSDNISSKNTLKTSRSCTQFSEIDIGALKHNKSSSNLKECKSCDENLIKFIFTKHGIQVISDVETIV